MQSLPCTNQPARTMPGPASAKLMLSPSVWRWSAGVPMRSSTAQQAVHTWRMRVGVQAAQRSGVVPGQPVGPPCGACKTQCSLQRSVGCAQQEGHMQKCHTQLCWRAGQAAWHSWGPSLRMVGCRDLSTAQAGAEPFSCRLQAPQLHPFSLQPGQPRPRFSGPLLHPALPHLGQLSSSSNNTPSLPPHPTPAGFQPREAQAQGAPVQAQAGGQPG